MRLHDAKQSLFYWMERLQGFKQLTATGSSVLLQKLVVPQCRDFLDFLTLDYGTDTLSRNVGKGLPLDAA
jgi:hypothetical protein